MTNPSPKVLARGKYGSVKNPWTVVRGAPLSANKPEILYVAAEYCPYCAGENWSLIMALSRFGRFRNLHVVTSSSTDIYPITRTFIVYRSQYWSQYLKFVSVTETDRNEHPLQSPSAKQQAVLNRYDTAGGIPFLDLNNRAVSSIGYDVGGASPQFRQSQVPGTKLESNLETPKKPG